MGNSLKDSNKNPHENTVYLSPLRNYRKLESPYKDEQKFQLMVEETDLLITIPKYIDMEEAARICVQYISKLRQELKEYILINPDFQHSLEPVMIKTVMQNSVQDLTQNPMHTLTQDSTQNSVPNIVKAMCQATEYANVGPFAAVAGSIAQMTSLMLVAWIRQQNTQKSTQIQQNLKQNNKNNISPANASPENSSRGNLPKNLPSDNTPSGNLSSGNASSGGTALANSSFFNDINVIVENGGDIYLYSEKERIVGILSNPTEGESVGLKIYPSDSPVSICSSSSKIGHSLSFGNGDIAMVRAKNAALADALATAYCNMLKTSKDINKVMERAKKDAEIQILHNPFNNDEFIFLNTLDTLNALDTQNTLDEENAQNSLDKKSIVAHNDLNGKNISNNINDSNYSNYSDKASTCLLENNALQNTLLGGVEGVFLQCDGHMGAWGKIELVAL